MGIVHDKIEKTGMLRDKTKYWFSSFVLRCKVEKTSILLDRTKY